VLLNWFFSAKNYKVCVTTCHGESPLGYSGKWGEMVAYKSHRAPKWERMGRPENIHGNMLLQTGRNDVSYILETTVYCIWAQFNKPLHQCRTQYLPYLWFLERVTSFKLIFQLLKVQNFFSRHFYSKIEKGIIILQQKPQHLPGKLSLKCRDPKVPGYDSK